MSTSQARKERRKNLGTNPGDQRASEFQMVQKFFHGVRHFHAAGRSEADVVKAAQHFFAMCEEAKSRGMVAEIQDPSHG